MRTHRLLTFLPLLAFGACQSMPPIVATPSFRATPDLARVNPSDIAVLPVEDNTRGQKVAWLLNEMREQAARTLVTRLYSPLDFALVDRALAVHNPVDASFSERLLAVAGKCGDDAALALRIDYWDDSEIMSRARVRFLVEAALVAKDGKILWSGRLEGAAKAGGSGPAPLDRAERARSVALIVIRHALGHLEKRRP